MHKCYSNNAYMHCYCNTCAFNILIFFGCVGYVRDSEWGNNKKIVKEWIFYWIDM